jgi:hypothetical protein
MAATHTETAEEVRGERHPLIQGRVVLETVQMNLSGQVATAAVRLREADRRVSGRVVDRNVEAQRPRLLGEAAARALTELMPLGYGLILSDIQSIATAAGDAMVAAVTLLTPEGEQVLMGVARMETGMAEAAVRAVLNAVNRRLSFVFADTTLISMN